MPMYLCASPGIQCRLHPLGASIQSVKVRNAAGDDLEVALSPLNFDTGEPDPSLAGRTIAPCCGRVRNGEIKIDGKTIQLPRNDGNNHIHGGPHGAAYQVWQGKQLSPARVRFTLHLADGLDGYPGNRVLTAEYEARENALQVTYTACTDQPTWLDMTNHVYWDLSGRFDGSAMEQQLEIAADRAVRNDEKHLPLKIVPAKGAFDFSFPVSPAERKRQYPEDEQLKIGRGYNNAFILHPNRDYAARLTSKISGLRMTMRTDQPAIVFYSGGFLGADTKLRQGGAVPGCALALEAQAIPDPFHLPGQEANLLYPGQEFRRTIRWECEYVKNASLS